jgi:molybdopterin-guanine dinucleotide biosynthesis protein A
LETSAIILAGGFSSRFAQDKGLLRLSNKPLVKHVLDAVNNIADERLLILGSKAQVEKYRKIAGSNTSIFFDNAKEHSPLVGALKGFEEAKGKYSLLLPCDTPLVSRDILTLLLELCVNRNAAVPRWPNCYVEPLQAVYCTRPALEAAAEAVRTGELNMQAMVDRLRNVRYVSTLVLQQLDPELRTFFNVNTPLDLRKAELMLRRAHKKDQVGM